MFTKQSSKKLENRHKGKYQIKKIINSDVVKLDLPGDHHVYPIFNVNLLKLTTTDNPYLNHVQPPGPSIEVDGETKYEITAIVNSYLFGRTKKLLYCVQ